MAPFAKDSLGSFSFPFTYYTMAVAEIARGFGNKWLSGDLFNAGRCRSTLPTTRSCKSQVVGTQQPRMTVKVRTG